MSTTLTNGLKLPDKGSVDWYADMQNNYAILDGAVGTVAEHTSQIAGKAPLVHTHTKSDITDLFNSANTWSGSQTFTENSIFSNFITSKESAAIPAGGYGKGIAFRDYQDNRLGYIQPFLTSDNAKRLLIGADSGDIASNSNLIPNANNSVNLGSSTNQWNNLYAKNYFYNGVAWGLDKANVWTRYNTFTGDARPIRLRGSNNDIYNVQPQSPIYSQIDFVDKNNDTMSYILFQHRTDATETHRLCLRQNRITLNAYYSVNLNNLGDFYPEQSNAINLGTSTNKWKTLNGVNPGALSLPKEEYSDVDISAQGLNWDLTGSSDNSYTPNRDGWLEIWAKRTSLPTAYISVGNAYVRQVSEATVFNFACVTCPVRNGQTYTVRILANECHVRIMNAEGNV